MTDVQQVAAGCLMTMTAVCEPSAAITAKSARGGRSTAGQGRP